MHSLLFYEKPGCAGNAQQKKLLRPLVQHLEVFDLLTTPWTVNNLRPFFHQRQVAEWFNNSAPQVKSGEIIPVNMSEQDALQLMLQQPLLIRRPLLQYGTTRQCGFVRGPVLNQFPSILKDIDELQECKTLTSAVTCGAI